MAGGALLVLDANVLIDYCAADRSVLTLAARHVGPIHVPSVLLDEVDDLDDNECERLGLIVVEQESSLLVAAGRRRPGLSYYDHVCLLAAKAAGWICVTNDGHLRRECKTEQVPVWWGLELMVPLVAESHLTVSAATTVAKAIHSTNPFYITDEIVTRFIARLARAAVRRKWAPEKAGGSGTPVQFANRRVCRWPGSASWIPRECSKVGAFRRYGVGVEVQMRRNGAIDRESRGTTIKDEPKTRMRGLGDVVSFLLGLFALKPCEACHRRAETLNGHVPFHGRRT